ncbi:aminotransferase [Aspergillus ambiguus]|uniref:aminotransferase n=1 Tax=Aspergillus ambiguus TaxID=176160 RepID=UPI003CCE151C
MTPELQCLADALNNKVATPNAGVTHATTANGETPSADFLRELHQSSSALQASGMLVTRTTTPREVPKEAPCSNLDNPAYTDHFVKARWNLENGWGDPQIVPYVTGGLLRTMSPLIQNAVNHCDGMKAYRGDDGKLRLFRSEYTCNRFRDFVKRKCLPDVEPSELLKLIKKLLALDAPKWLSKEPRGVLYLKTILSASAVTTTQDGPNEAILCIFCLWSLPHDPGRALPYKTADGKASAKKRHLPNNDGEAYSHKKILWLLGTDARISGTQGTNFFVLWVSRYGKLELITTPLEEWPDISGLGRDSVLELARKRLTKGPVIESRPNGSQGFVEPVVVTEKNFTIKDIIIADDENRLRGAFAVGSDCRITPVSAVRHGNREISFPLNLFPFVSLLQTWVRDIIYGKEENEWASVVDG